MVRRSIVFAVGREVTWQMPVITESEGYPQKCRWDLVKDLPSLFQGRSSEVECPDLGKKPAAAGGI